MATFLASFHRSLKTRQQKDIQRNIVSVHFTLVHAMLTVTRSDQRPNCEAARFAGDKKVSGWTVLLVAPALQTWSRDIITLLACKEGIGGHTSNSFYGNRKFTMREHAASYFLFLGTFMRGCLRVVSARRTLWVHIHSQLASQGPVGAPRGFQNI